MPIDIGTGAVHLEAEDFSLPGKFAVRWKRSFHTTLVGQDSPLGPGWTSPFFSKLTRKGKDYHFVGPAGSLIVFPDPEDKVDHQETVRDYGSFHEISRRGVFLHVNHWSPGGRITRYAFKSERNGDWWQLRFVENPSGDGVELAWDEQGRLKGIRQKLEKRTLILAYGSANRIHSVSFRHTDGRQTLLAKYEYNTSGKLSAAYDAAGIAQRYEYNSEGRLSREIARDGGVFQYKYDEHGRCVRYAGLDNYDLKILRYQDPVGWTHVTDSLGKTSHYEWMAGGQIIQEINPLGAITLTQYDQWGRVVKKTGPSGKSWEYAYDKAGNRSTVVNPLGGELSIHYNDTHLPVAITDPSGRKRSVEYDDSNRVSSKFDAAKRKWSYFYDAQGNLEMVVNPAGHRRRQTFSETGSLLETEDWEGNLTRFRYDEFGKLVERTDPDGARIRFEYDVLGNLIRVWRGNQLTTEYAYNANRDIVKVTKPGGRETTYRYGTCKRILERLESNGTSTRYRWGSEPNRLWEIRNGKNQSYAFHYDDAGRITREIGFDGRVTSLQYDAMGRCITKTNGAGQALRYAYDDLDRLVEEKDSDGNASTFRYDASGFLIGASNPWATLAFERDELGRVIKEDQNGIELSWAFGPSGEILSCTTSTGWSTAQRFDKNGLVSRITLGDLGEFTFSRDPVGREVERMLPNGKKLSQKFDDMGRLSRQSIRTWDGSKSAIPEDPALWNREYQYDDRHRLQKTVDSDWGESRFEYDASDGLIGFSNPHCASTRYQFDLDGNPLWLRFGAESDTECFYRQGDVLERMGAVRFGHDGNGRRCTRDSGTGSDSNRDLRYEWDAKDRLVGFQKGDQRWEYGYDPLGRRLFKRDASGETRFVWDQDVLVQELSSGGKTVSWCFDPHSFKPIARVDGNRIFSFITDQAGTPRTALDEKGETAWAAIFQPWGSVAAEKGDSSLCPFRFQGQYFDAESGLHYNRFRYYDPEIGRYISQDPVRLFGGLNPYSYARNPVQTVDPYGLCPNDDEEEKPTLYRGERSSNDPEKVFAEGLKSKGDNMDLLRHCQANQSDSGYIATSTDKEIAEGFAGKNGYVYVIKSDKGIDTNEALGDTHPFPEQKEVAIPKEVHPSEIVGAYPMKGGKPTGDFIPNPNYGGD